MPEKPPKPKRVRLSCNHVVKLPRGAEGDEMRAGMAEGEKVMVICPWHGPRGARELIP